MDNIVTVKKIMHFYYCLLVNIRIRKIRHANLKKQDNSRIIKKWLKNAKDKKLFDPIIFNEIQWLMSEVDRYSPVQFERRVDTIYSLPKDFIQNEIDLRY